MILRFCLLILGSWLAAPRMVWAQPAAPTPSAAVRPASSFFTTYRYLAYTILDRSSGSAPVAARGVGGTLTLQPDGRYQKRLTLTANGGPLHFNQDGQFRFAGDRILFSYTDKQGQPRTDQGTFQLRNQVLTLIMEGYPAGNHSTYTLRATAAVPGR